MGELALGDRASQSFGDLLLRREVVDARGAVLLDPELRAAAHGCCCRVGVLDRRLLVTGALFGAAGTAFAKSIARAGYWWSTELHRLPRTKTSGRLRADGQLLVVIMEFELSVNILVALSPIVP